MTAKEKFEARLKELGLYEEWVKQAECGKVAVERDDGIIPLLGNKVIWVEALDRTSIRSVFQTEMS